MTPPEVATDMAALLADASWVRALARTLVHRSQDADDLVQDACLQALRRPPRHGDNLRAWFQRVLQNLVRQHRRAARRRDVRQAAAIGMADRPLDGPAAHDLVERAATCRAVVDAVLSLDEPYRATILLRFFEGLPPRAVAARMAVPVATVHTRLQRGCTLLRRRLDATSSRGRTWVAAFFPLPRLATSLTVCELLMHAKALVFGAAVVFGAVVWLGSGWFASATAALEPAPPNAVQVAAPAAPGGTGVERRVVAPEGTEVDGPVPAAAKVAPSRRIDGRVVDGDGRPVAALQVRLGALRARSDGAGAFALIDDAARSGEIVVDEPEWQTVMHADVLAGEPPRLALVVAAPRLLLNGRVRASAGRAIAGARVGIAWPNDLRTRLSDISDVAAERTLFALSAEDGSFTLVGARVRGAQLVTSAEGYLPDRRPLPEAGERGLEIVLREPQVQPGTLLGQVVDPHGVPVAGARVALGPALVRSDPDGRFLIADDGESPLLCAATAGYRRATAARPAGGFAAFVTLTLGGPPLAIRGRVVDHAGKPLPAVRVWAIDSTLFSRTGELLAAEGIAGACTTMGELQERFRRGELTDPERTLRETPTAAWPWVKTGADGAFTLGGLEERPYRLRAMDDRTVLMVDTQPVAAGSNDVVIAVPRDALFDDVAGQIVAGNGDPVAGVRVSVQVDTQRLGNSTMHGRAVATTTSDATGRFELHDVPKDRAYLRLDGENILPLEHGRGVEGGLLVLTGGRTSDLRIEVRVRVHVQVELVDAGLADTLAVLDLAGRPLIVNVFQGRSRRETDTLPFTDGKTPVFVVPDTASTLVLRKGDQEVRREPLQLRVGAVNSLRF